MYSNKINKNTTIKYNYKYPEEFNDLEKFIEEHIDSPPLKTISGLKKQLNRDWFGKWNNITIYNINEKIKKVETKEERNNKIKERTIQLFLQQSSLDYLLQKSYSLLKSSLGNQFISIVQDSFRHQIYKIGKTTISLHIIIFNIQMGLSKTNIGAITITYDINHTAKNIKITFYFSWRSKAISNFMKIVINEKESFRADNIYEDIANKLDVLNNSPNNWTNILKFKKSLGVNNSRTSINTVNLTNNGSVNSNGNTSSIDSHNTGSIHPNYTKNNTGLIDKPFIEYTALLKKLSIFNKILQIIKGGS